MRVCSRGKETVCVCARACAGREGEGRGKVSNHTQKNKTRRFPGLDLLCQEPRGRTEPPGERRKAAHASARVLELALVRFLEDPGVLEDFSLPAIPASH